MKKIKYCLNSRGCANTPSDEFYPFCSERCIRIYYGEYRGYCAYCRNLIPEDRTKIHSLEKYYCSNKCFRLAVYEGLG